MTNKTNLTLEEKKQVINYVDKMVLKMNNVELMDIATVCLEDRFLSWSKNDLIQSGLINNNERTMK